jgi:hypothetical protein
MTKDRIGSLMMRLLGGGKTAPDKFPVQAAELGPAALPESKTVTYAWEGPYATYDNGRTEGEAVVLITLDNSRRREVKKACRTLGKTKDWAKLHQDLCCKNLDHLLVNAAPSDESDISIIPAWQEWFKDDGGSWYLGQRIYYFHGAPSCGPVDKLTGNNEESQIQFDSNGRRLYAAWVTPQAETLLSINYNWKQDKATRLPKVCLEFTFGKDIPFLPPGYGQSILEYFPRDRSTGRLSKPDGAGRYQDVPSDEKQEFLKHMQCVASMYQESLDNMTELRFQATLPIAMSNVKRVQDKATLYPASAPDRKLMTNANRRRIEFF